MATAHQLCVFAAFSLVPRKRLMRRCCFDPPEEPLDLPAALVERADRQRRQGRVVGQEDQRLARLGVLEPNTPQVLGVLPGGVVAVEHHLLIADHAGAAIDGRRVDASRVHRCLGSRGKEGPDLMQRVQPRVNTLVERNGSQSNRLRHRPLDDASEGLPRHELHHLREQRLATVHASPRVVQTREHRKQARFKSWTPRSPEKPLSVLALRRAGSRSTGPCLKKA